MAFFGREKEDFPCQKKTEPLYWVLREGQNNAPVDY